MMDHIVYLDARWHELENLLNGNKSMIIQAASGRKLPQCKVNKGDVLYFINSSSEKLVKAKGVVNSVMKSDKLTVEESFETIIRNQDKLQLPDKQFYRFAGKCYLLLVGLDEIQEVEPFVFDNSDFICTNDWIAVGKIEMAAIRSI